MSKQGSWHTYQLRYILKGQAHKLQTMEKHNIIRKTLNAAIILHAKHINLKTQLFQVPHKKLNFFSGTQLHLSTNTAQLNL